MRTLHLFDVTADWEQRLAVGQLLDRLASGGHRQWLASTHPRIPPQDWFGGPRIMRTPIRLGMGFSAAPALRRLIDRHQIDVVHAWGVQAAVAGAAARAKRTALVVERFDPRVSDVQAKSMRALAEGGRFAVVCSSATVRRRLVEKGVPDSLCVVIRPGVDFKRINAARREGLIRSRLGVSAEERIAVASYPVTRHGGHERVVWGGHMQHYLDSNCRMIIAGRSGEYERLRRLATTMPGPNAVLWVGSEYRYEELIAMADCLVITPFGDVSTTPVAWAMAAGVPVIGSAVYAVAELLAHRHNALLIKPERGPAMTIKIVSALQQVDTLANETETARGQAYEVFSVRRYADQHAQLYENLTAGTAAGTASGTAPGDQITDSAVIG